MLVPLLRTESIEIIPEGSQYTRSEKTELIASWDLAQNHLNVCVNPLHGGKNCSCCMEKCMPTMFVLDTIGILKEYVKVFDEKIYKENLFKYKCRLVTKNKQDGFTNDNYLFAKKHKVSLPPRIIAHIILLPEYLFSVGKCILRKIISSSKYRDIAKKYKNKKNKYKKRLLQKSIIK